MLCSFKRPRALKKPDDTAPYGSLQRRAINYDIAAKIIVPLQSAAPAAGGIRKAATA